MESGLTEIAHVIQLAVAPVFLLTGVAGLLSVLTSRLARIIDRSRVLEAVLVDQDENEHSSLVRELVVLGRRSRAVNLAIALVTLAALLVCAVIAALFLGVFFAFDASTEVGGIFITAMLALIVGLIAFLREIHLANLGLRISSGPKRC
jgi:di/tricarboxylate transporter